MCPPSALVTHHHCFGSFSSVPSQSLFWFCSWLLMQQLSLDCLPSVASVAEVNMWFLLPNSQLRFSNGYYVWYFPTISIVQCSTMLFASWLEQQPNALVLTMHSPHHQELIAIHLACDTVILRIWYIWHASGHSVGIKRCIGLDFPH